MPSKGIRRDIKCSISIYHIQCICYIHLLSAKLGSNFVEEGQSALLVRKRDICLSIWQCRCFSIMNSSSVKSPATGSATRKLRTGSWRNRKYAGVSFLVNRRSPKTNKKSTDTKRGSQNLLNTIIWTDIILNPKCFVFTIASILHFSKSLPVSLIIST